MTRAAAYILILWGIVLLARNVRDEVQGETRIHVPPPPWEEFNPVRYHPFLHPADLSMLHPIRAREAPQQFRQAMTRHWLLSLLPLCAGLWLLAWLRRMDRLDPLSPSFQGTDALDDLDRTMRDQQQQRNNPKA